jgi:hypothetical protein
MHDEVDCNYFFEDPLYFKYTILTKETIESFQLSKKVLVLLCSYRTKIISVTEISPVNKRDRYLGTREFSCQMNEMKRAFYINFIIRRDRACKFVEMFSR